ncbi:GNAT family N-acetyltransferase [Vibrio gazogenes]|uniref:GNAT family N-acetyltransferase n=1 Tax=Vibrio gazogenes TaxID=687 RepID=A0A1Z2SKP6_VIBGA|nr:GNAT family N-acetyltransferase [Vibrio gazogenes]ASA57705.1 GNAT family N-acetyltransferase [Vibrio gazogenes]
MLDIKEPTLSDAPAIVALLASLGYPETEAFIEKRMTQLLSHDNDVLLIAVKEHEIIGVIALHFIPQLALPGDFCRISYFCISETSRGEGVGTMLESHAVDIAKARGCDRIEVHCHARRVDAHRFYDQNGYVESPKYLVKLLN